MTLYKVTIHEHIIYDSFIDAPDQNLAYDIGREQIENEDNTKWQMDPSAGWHEVGDIEIA